MTIDDRMNNILSTNRYAITLAFYILGESMDIKTILIILLAILVLVIFTLFILKRHLRGSNDPFEDMHGDEFEDFCVNLLERRGFEDVSKTPASHDYGIDIFAQKDGITYAIQCKCYSDTVGIKAVQEAYAGKDYYDAMVGVVMTNQDFTKTGLEFAEKLRVIMWNGDDIYKMSRNIK